MSGQDRHQETVKHCYRLIKSQGPIRTLGLLIGILARLSRQDFQILQEIKARADRADSGQ